MNDFNKNNFFSFIDEVTGKRKFYLNIDGQMIEVEKDVFYICYNSYRKELRDNKRDQLYGLISYDTPLNDGFYLLDLLGNNENPIDEITYQDQITKIRQIIKSLNQEEQDLLMDLFVHGKKEQEIAEQYRVSRQMINKRKQKILKKIKMLLRNGC